MKRVSNAIITNVWQIQYAKKTPFLFFIFLYSTKCYIPPVQTLQNFLQFFALNSRYKLLVHRSLWYSSQLGIASTHGIVVVNTSNKNIAFFLEYWHQIHGMHIAIITELKKIYLAIRVFHFWIVWEHWNVRY